MAGDGVRVMFAKGRVETDRLILVPKSSAHGEAIFREYRQPVTRYLNHPPPRSLASLLERIQEHEAAMGMERALYLSVLLKGSEEFIGCFSLEDIGTAHPEMGGWLKASAHGHRYGREAARALKQWAEQHLSHQYLVWPCALQNIASRKLAEALGGHVHREYSKRALGGAEMQYAEYRIPRTSS
jgi:[ribosomal protein S5]-alanine N-acetyltransferase